MIGLDKDVARLAQQPSKERLRGLQRIIPCAKIRSILKPLGKRRFCPRLPDWFMVWFVIAMGLFRPDSYRQIFRWLQPYRGKDKGGTPGRPTLCEARKRLGVAPLRRLWNSVTALLATRKTPGAFHRGLRLMAIDGFVVNLADTPANARIFGRPKGGRSPGAFPQARVVALCETGTHVVWRQLIKPCRCGEVPMATSLLKHLQPEMLLVWDRGFLSYVNVAAVLRAKAHMLARIKKNHIFTVVRRLRDGSYLAKIYPSSRHREADRDGVTVRIVEYTFKDPALPGSGERHRLLTTLLDCQEHPAKTLVLLYHQRWEEELTIDELKTHQGERLVLRSKTPQGVVQEIYGLLLGHFVVRRLMFEAAQQEGISPLRVSFIGTLKILRCRLAECPKSPQGLKRWFDNLVGEVREEVLEPRRYRINPRVIRQKMSKWPKKRPQHSRNPQPKRKIEQVIAILH